MSTEKSVARLVEDIFTRFPDEGNRIKLHASRLGFEKNTATVVLEQFAQIATDAMEHRDEVKINMYLKFMSERLRAADEDVHKYIDVYFAENLMFNLSTEEKKWSWSKIPSNLKQLYSRMWGEPSF